jgi:hypothetical protein
LTELSTLRRLLVTYWLPVERKGKELVLLVVGAGREHAPLLLRAPFTESVILKCMDRRSLTLNFLSAEMLPQQRTRVNGETGDR